MENTFPCSHSPAKTLSLKTTQYFEAMRQRADRSAILLEWIQRVVESPEAEAIQQDGRMFSYELVAA